jgi:phosphoglycerate dehydrogenase-like enzyme
LSGAALDVTEPEPLPADHPLWDAPNVQISPHISGIGEEYWLRSFDILRVNLDRTRRGESLVNAYKRGRGY